MSALGEWLAERSPSPPPDLAAALESVHADGAPDAVLAAAAESRLEEARSRPGRVRESAFRLLEADALFTYACEAALKTDDPEAVLRRILASASR